MDVLTEPLYVAIKQRLDSLTNEWQPIDLGPMNDTDREAVARSIQVGIAVERVIVTLSVDGMPRLKATCERFGYRPFLPSGVNGLATDLACFVPGTLGGSQVGIAYSGRELRLSADGERFLSHRHRWYFDKWIEELAGPQKKVVDGGVSIIGPPELLSAKTDQAEEQPSLESRALALLTDHPDWTDTYIAESLNCNRTSLYRLPNFVAARELLKRDGIASQPRGSRTDSRVDAWDNGE
jgi:hypothetical protein